MFFLANSSFALGGIAPFIRSGPGLNFFKTHTPRPQSVSLDCTLLPLVILCVPIAKPNHRIPEIFKAVLRRRHVFHPLCIIRHPLQGPIAFSAGLAHGDVGEGAPRRRKCGSQGRGEGAGDGNSRSLGFGLGAYGSVRRGWSWWW